MKMLCAENSKNILINQTIIVKHNFDLIENAHYLYVTMNN